MIKALLKLFLWICLSLQAFALQAAPVIENWQAIHEAFFNKKTVVDAGGQIEIEAPMQAEDAALVPFALTVALNNGLLAKVYLFADANPILHTATFHVLNPTKNFSTATRLRLEKNSVVRVIAETQSGDLLMQTVEIKTPGGGCGGGGTADESALRTSAGQIKVRVNHEDAHRPAFNFHIRHPMRTGFERTLQGYYAKAWYINQLNFMGNSTRFLQIDVGPGISADPTFKIFLPAAFGILQIQASDNEGKTFQHAMHLAF